ncbi:max binding protein mnt, putative [Ixodes scapularis]|uniref:Max-binding protein MNT n=1 Tax=Ixodes scapularis TaxID=6945 RepID=B7PTG3_IXOSC|nr:max binding protein mnt, putative [Ixodes scapularis]|eukprot:XP_002404397.1 max binding protein mnt, putative [Ixodes scapularis]
MSLDTLLEAAKYIEYRSEAKARGEIPHDYQTFALQSKAVAAEEYRAQQQQSRQQLLQHASRCDNNSSDSYSSNHFDDGKEKRRRAHLKECFETLKRQLPNMDDRKTSNLTILRGALRYITSLKRREREYEHEMERLAREKIAAQQRLAVLKKDLSLQLDYLDMSAILPDQDNETTTTASGNSENGKPVSSSIVNVSNNKPVASTSSMTSLVASYGGSHPSATTGATVVVSSGVGAAPAQTVANTRGLATLGVAPTPSLANSKCATALLAPSTTANLATLVTSQQPQAATTGLGLLSHAVTNSSAATAVQVVANPVGGVKVLAGPAPSSSPPSSTNNGGHLVALTVAPAVSTLAPVVVAPPSSTLAAMASSVAPPKSLVRTTSGANVGRAGGAGTAPVALVTAAQAKSLFLGPHGVAVTASPVGSGGVGVATTGVVQRRGLPQVLTPRALATSTVLSGTAGALKQVRAGTAPGGQALSQLAAHVTHVAAASSPTAAVGQLPLMAPLSVVGHLPALLSQQFLSPGANLGTLTAVVKPLVVVSLPNVVAQPATPTSVGTAQ